MARSPPFAAAHRSRPTCPRHRSNAHETYHAPPESAASCPGAAQKRSRPCSHRAVCPGTDGASRLGRTLPRPPRFRQPARGPVTSRSTRRLSAKGSRAAARFIPSSRRFPRRQPAQVTLVAHYLGPVPHGGRRRPSLAGLPERLFILRGGGVNRHGGNPQDRADRCQAAAHAVRVEERLRRRSGRADDSAGGENGLDKPVDLSTRSVGATIGASFRKTCAGLSYNPRPNDA